MLNRILITLALLIIAFPQAYAAKPASALSVNMQWSSVPVKGQVNEFKVIISSSINASDLKLEITVPPTVQLVDGIATSTLKIEAATPLEVVFKAFLAENSNGSIGASISIGQRGKAYFSANHELLISSEQQSLKARNNTKPPYEIIERNGVRIREYKLPD